MRNIFKKIATCLGALLSLSACSLFPSDYSNNTDPSTCVIEFGERYQKCPVDKEGENTIRILNANNKYIAFRQPHVSCGYQGVGYEVIQQDRTTWVVRYNCAYEQSVLFNVSAYVGDNTISGSFNVSFTESEDGGEEVPPSASVSA